MIERRNIARQDILLAIAEEMVQSLHLEQPLDLNRFYNDLMGVALSSSGTGHMMCL
jgi:hypothetical protein